jgi:large subunit ribosomal protein L15
MKLYELSPAPGSTSEPKRKGRGIGSGNGKTGGRGHKGQNARSGGGVRPGFDGTSVPYIRKLPKRGFKNYTKTNYAEVNVAALDCFESGTVVDAALLKSVRLIGKELDGVKVLGMGEIGKPLTVKAAAFSASAKEKIEAAGGKAEVV